MGVACAVVDRGELLERTSKQRRVGARILTLVVAFALALLRAHAARADGAFPDSQTILVPAAYPEELILATNFGLIITEDAGKTWGWSCEVPANAFGVFYQQSPPPRRRMLTVASNRLVFSDDFTCGWTVAGGLPAATDVLDVFVDRAAGDRVLAVGSRCCDAGQETFTAFESTNGGATFDRTIYEAPAGTSITGIESALSEPSTIYLTLSRTAADGTAIPILARSTTGGSAFTLFDLSVQLGGGQLRLIAVDPEDPRRVFLLRVTPEGQSLVMTRDGGATAVVALVPAGIIRSALRTTAGSILVATDNAGLPSLFRSQDGGDTFQSVFNPPHIRGLAERAGTIYAATDNARDGHAVATSSDQGTTWLGALAYAEVQSIVPCLKATCQPGCQTEVFLGLWPAAVCSADGPPLPMASGGAGGAASGAGGGPGVGGAAGGGDVPGDADVGGDHGGCQCGTTPVPGKGDGSGGWPAILAAWGVVSARRSRHLRVGIRSGTPCRQP